MSGLVKVGSSPADPPVTRSDISTGHHQYRYVVCSVTSSSKALRAVVCFVVIQSSVLHSLLMTVFQAQLGTWHTASPLWSKPSLVFKLYASKMSWSETLPLSWGMLMQRSIRQQTLYVLGKHSQLSSFCHQDTFCLSGAVRVSCGAHSRPRSYRAYGSSKEDNPVCDVTGFESTDMELLRHVSFVDCPGETKPLVR